MTTPFRLMQFCAFSPGGWEGLDAANGYDWTRADTQKEMLRLLERAGFETVMFADTSAISTFYGGNTDVYVKYGMGEGFHNDPVAMMTALAQATQRIGLVCTLSTSLYPPELLAQTIASLDHLTRGRIGWNIVTSMGKDAAQNFGVEKFVSSEQRYSDASEFVDLVDKLWSYVDGYQPSEAGPRKINLPKLPQGRPTIMQAGGSEAGRDFAAKHADGVLAHRNSPEDMKSFRDDIRRRAEKFGRDPDSLNLFFTFTPFVGESQEEAAALREKALTSPTKSIEAGLANFSLRIGYDVSGLPLDEPLPRDLKIAGSTGVLDQHTGNASPTLREIAISELLKETFSVQGTPVEVADRLEEVMDQVGGDGYAVRGSLMPRSVLPMVEHVVPILQERGLTRKGYRYSTFRQNMLDADFITAGWDAVSNEKKG
jgi:alkanesulfonate monooxygenase SsuD/methylene tetrahydromethanopterin reductase-like flavin-dependent oxidoreductase (luciferase family)